MVIPATRTEKPFENLLFKKLFRIFKGESVSVTVNFIWAVEETLHFTEMPAGTELSGQQDCSDVTEAINIQVSKI